MRRYESLTREVSDHGDNLYLPALDRLYLSYDYGDSWQDITPTFPNFKQIRDMDVSWDGHIYLATLETPILKSAEKVVSSVSSKEHQTLHFSVYPNPAYDYISIVRNNNLALRTCDIYNLRGELVLRQTLVADEILNIQNLDSGLYIIDLILENGAHHRERFFVVR